MPLSAQPLVLKDIAKTSGAVSVLVTNTVVLGNNPGRSEVTIENTDATNPVYLAFATTRDGQGVPVAPTATASNGIKLAAGVSWTSNIYNGPIAAISTGGTVVCTVAEF